VPDNNSLRDAVRRSAHGHFSDDANQSIQEVTRKIANRLNMHDPSDVFRIMNYVRGARREYDAGRAADDANQHSTPFAPTNVDPSLANEIVNYRYRTVVEIIDPATMDRYTTVVPVDSTTPLTPDEIRDAARQLWSSVRGPNREYYTRGDLGNMPAADVHIVGGGRRG